MAEASADPAGVVADAVVDAVNATVQAAVEDETGFFVAYAALFAMAVLPIYFGSRMSVHHKSTNSMETMSHKDATMFPLYASGALFGLYIVFKFFSKEYINLLLGLYFLLLGVISLCQSLRPILEQHVPRNFVGNAFKLQLTRGEGSTKQEYFAVELDKLDLVCAGVALPLGAWYIFTKNWVANNIFGISFSINGISMLSLGSFKVAAMLLCGLFFYDIFWVFGTDVMVTVAKSFDAPIKLVFPKDFLELGLGAQKFAMLGLGDIVIPGVVVALMLRFDDHLRQGSSAYFTTTLAAYGLGLLATIGVMHYFKAAQPALLYLVPCCLLAPLLLSAVKGQTKDLLAYNDEGAGGEEQVEEEQVHEEEVQALEDSKTK